MQVHPDYDPEVSVIQHLHEEGEIIHMICVPVLDGHGNTIAIIQATNKKGPSPNRGFSQNDEQVLQALATYVSVTIQNVNSEEEAGLKEIIQILRGHDESPLK